jgi:hypothetical protein
LNFSAPLIPASARNRASYRLVLPGRDRVLGTRDDRTLRFRSAVYQSSANAVLLSPSVRLTARQTFRVVAIASGNRAMVRDIFGRPIDGDNDGQPGGDFKGSFGPQTSALKLAARSDARLLRRQ